jgi:hypothetical protein
VRVHRLIFRLDFQRANFAIIDSPGRVMQLLSEMGDEQYWPEFQDSAASRTISGSARDEKDGTFRQFTSEPTAMHFVIESVNGLNISALASDKTVTALFKGVHAFCDEFKIDKFSRVGIRFIVLGNVTTATPSLLPKVESLIDNGLLDCVSSSLGETKDVGLAFDGEDADRLKYHFRMGPYTADEAKKYFSVETAKRIEVDGVAANFVSDLDFYEQNFAMTVRASQWCKEPIDKSQKVLSLVDQFLSKRK